MTEWLILKLTCWPADARRRFAMRMLVWSVFAAVVNLVVYWIGWIGIEGLVVVTLLLSWFAITVTAADVVIGTDVRVEVEVNGEDNSEPTTM